MFRWLLLLAVLIAGPARAEWWEARTDNFVVYSESSGADAREFAETLERFDMSLRSLQNVKLSVAPSDVHRVTIYRFGDINDIGRLAGSPGVAGFYIPRLTGPVAFTPARDQRSRERSIYGRRDPRTELDARTVLFHEYSHHFMYKHFAAAYPHWYSEGLAEVYSTIVFNDDGSFHIGNPSQDRSDLLFGGISYSMKRLLQRKDKPDREDVYARYSHGWLLSHYLTFEASRKGQLQTFLRLINDGSSEAEAARQAFGDLDQLDRDVNRYKGLGQRGKLPGSLVRPATFAAPTAKLRRLDDGEEAIMRIQMRSARGVTRKTAGDVANDGRAIAAKFPNNFAVQRALAEAEFDAQNLDAAERAARAAIALRPQSADALYYLGLIYLERGKADPKHLATARSWFVQANKADPQHPGPLLGNYLTFASASAPIPEAAIIGLERAYELAPYDADLRLAVSKQLLTEKKGDLARMVLLPLALSPHESKRAKALSEVVELIEAGKLDDARAKLVARLAEEEKEKNGSKGS